MPRRAFIEAQGATCSNWNWSWSFVNHPQKFVIFGAWDIHTAGDTTLILSREWAISRKGKKQPGYPQSLEHVRLIEEEGYSLKTFPLEHGYRDDDPTASAKIKGIKPVLTARRLLRVGGNWYARDIETEAPKISAEVDLVERFVEGAVTTVTANRYERDPKARAACIAHYGCVCAVCAFEFERAYGDLGARYIHVHHVVPLSDMGGAYHLNPVLDLIPVCPNCHAMIHRVRPALKVDELRRHIADLRDAVHTG